MKKVCILILILNLLCSCVIDKIDQRKIKIQNNSSSTIYWIRSDEGMFKKPIYNSWIDSIDKDSFFLLSNVVPKWEESIRRAEENKINFFIVPTDSVNKHGWDRVFESKLFVRVYSVNMTFLEKDEWIIEYP